jgi:hypothetical protein
MIDEYQGQGGSYVLDPTTGKRKPTQTPEVLNDGTVNTQTPDPGKSRSDLRD